MKPLLRMGLCIGWSLFACTGWSHDLDFQKKTLCDEAYYCDGIATGDFNRDGAVDIVAGPFWYRGPEFQQRRGNLCAGTVRSGNGPIGQPLLGRVRFRRRRLAGRSGAWAHASAPGTLVHGPGEARHWQCHVVFPKIQGENSSLRGCDGRRAPGDRDTLGAMLGIRGSRLEPAAGTLEHFHGLGAEGDWPQFHHGQGVGDITGDGLPEILINEGWLTRDASQATAEANRLAVPGATLFRGR